MDAENNASAQVVQLEIMRETRPKPMSISIESERCRQCRMKLRQLTEFIYLAAEIADDMS
jgi:hypothetical protein